MRGSCRRIPSFLVGALSRSRCLPGALWLSDALLILLIPLILKILIQTVHRSSSPDNVSGVAAGGCGSLSAVQCLPQIGKRSKIRAPVMNRGAGLVFNFNELKPHESVDNAPNRIENSGDYPLGPQTPQNLKPA